MDSLAGRTAFITGGARGIGLGIARACARSGMNVAIADVDEQVLRSAAVELGTTTRVAHYVLDVRDREAYADVADAVERDLGPVTLLVNNAGVVDAISPSRMNYASWDWVIGVDLGGVYHGIQTFVPRMIQRGTGGHVVNTASGAGLLSSGGGFLYQTAKHGVVGLSESLREELRHHGIGVTLLCPGAVATDIVRNTQAVRPAGSPQHSSTISARLDTEHALLLSEGVPPDTVGEMVLTAVQDDELYVLTSDLSREVAARAERIIAAVPAHLAPAAPQEHS